MQGTELIDSAFCENCWNREMPNETLAKIVPLPMTPITEPKKEVDAADYIEIYTDGHKKGYEEGLNDAWELAKKFFADMKESELEEIFGKHWSFPGIMELTPQEAIAKMKAYEEQSKIEVGDVVLIYGEEAVVTRIVDGHANILFGDGVTNNMPLKDLVGDKTGKHIDIKSFLEQLRG